MLPDNHHDILGPPSDSPEEWFARGVNFTQGKEFAAAEACFRKTLALAPESLPTLLNLGYVLGEQGRYEESLRCYDRILAVFPGSAEARYNRAAHLLRLGNLKDGFAEYESRFAVMKGADSRTYVQPRWDGSPLHGRSILVYCEQGLGDALMFVRYVPLLERLGGRVVLEVQQPLVALMAQLEGVAQVVAKSALPPVTDTHIPLLTLPYLLGTVLETIPSHVPYLEAPPEKLAEWHARIGAPSHRFRVGIAWAGKEQPYPNRSCPPEFLAPLLQVPDVDFFSLQVGETDRFPLSTASAGRVTDLTGHIYDFADTAALIAGLDLVITIDTAVAHLAGALGKPTWVMLPRVADWRWLQREDSPWYPTMRLFRQTRDEGWLPVIGDVAAALQGLVAHRTAEDPEALFQEAKKRIEQGDPAGAIGPLQKLCSNDPDDPAIWYQLGRAHNLNGEPTGAEQCYRRALSLHPNSPAILFSLGQLSLAREDFPDAESLLARAHSLAPNSMDILLDLGAAFVAQGKIDEAFECCRKMLAIDPRSALALNNLAHLQLGGGDYTAGFANFEARLMVEKFQIDTRIYRQPRWDGSPLEGKSILVFGEQGMGDVIQFSRYIPLLAARGASVVFEIDPPLIPLFEGFPGTSTVVPKSTEPPLTQLYIQLLSLPHLLGTSRDSVPADVPYLFSDPVKTALWHDRLSADGKLRVGLVWGGSPRNANDKQRSCPVGLLAPLGRAANVSLFSLQVGPAAGAVASAPAELGLTDLAEDLKDWTDTAAVIANLDLVITVDTAVAHLAGALGRTVWVMLPFAGDWRWIRGRSDTPWYPSMRLFWQERWGDWAGVIERVGAALEGLARERHD